MKNGITMSATELNRGQLQKLAENPSQGSFIMLNLLKFKKDWGRKQCLRYLKKQPYRGLLEFMPLSAEQRRQFHLQPGLI